MMRNFWESKGSEVSTYKRKFEGRFEICADIIRNSLLDTQDIFADSMSVTCSTFGTTHATINIVAYFMEQCEFVLLEKYMICGFFGVISGEGAHAVQNFHA